jgi:hypothetical protein
MVNAYGVSIRFRNTPATTSSTSAPADETKAKAKPTKSSSAFENGLNAANNAGNAHSNSSSSGLSTGAKAGIGVGVAVGAIALIAGLVWFLMVRKRRAAAAAAAPGAKDNALDGPPQPAELEPEHHQQAELSSTSPSVAASYHPVGTDYSGSTEYHGAFRPQNKMPVELDAGVYYEK